MLTHTVVLTLVDTATRADRTAIAEGLSDLAGQVPGLVGVVVHEDLDLAEGNADLAFSMTFEDVDAWRGYSTHPAHVDLATRVIKPVVAAKVALQHV